MEACQLGMLMRDKRAQECKVWIMLYLVSREGAFNQSNKVQLKIEKSNTCKNLDILDDREKEVVIGRFGLEHSGDERTQREIAKELGISRSYVSRIEKHSL